MYLFLLPLSDKLTSLYHFQYLHVERNLLGQLLGFRFVIKGETLTLTPAVKYYSAAVRAQCPCFGNSLHDSNDFRFLLHVLHSYNSCGF